MPRERNAHQSSTESPPAPDPNPIALTRHAVKVALAVLSMEQQDLARRSGIHPTTLSRILSGAIPGTPEQWQGIWAGLSSDRPKS